MMIAGLKVIRTLVIGDDDLYKMANEQLSNINGTKFEAKIAKSIKDARLMCDAEHFNVVLLKITDGELGTIAETVKEIKKRTKNAAVIAYSRDYNHSHEHDMAALDAGVSDFIAMDDLTAPKLEKSVRYCLKNNCR